MSGVMTEIVNIFTSGITGIGGAVAEGLSELAQGVFLTGTGDAQTLSVFGALIILFSAISLGFSLCRWIVNMVGSLGARNR